MVNNLVVDRIIDRRFGKEGKYDITIAVDASFDQLLKAGLGMQIDQSKKKPA